MKHRVKIFSALISIVLFADFVINLQAENLPKSLTTTQEYEVFAQVGKATKDTKINRNLLRTARNKKVDGNVIVEKFLDELFFVDHKLARHIYSDLESEYLKHSIHMKEYNISAQKQRVNKSSIDSLSDSEVLSRGKALNVQEFEVYYIEPATASYIFEQGNNAYKALATSEQFIARTALSTGRGFDSEQLNFYYSAVLEIGNRLSMYNGAYADYYEQAYQLVKDYTGNVGTFSPAHSNYVYLAPFTLNSIQRPISMTMDKQLSRTSDFYNYLANTIINKQIDPKTIDSVKRIGTITHVGDIHGYDLLRGVLDYDTNLTTLESIFLSTPREIFEKRKTFVVATKGGMYLIKIKECTDLVKLRKALTMKRSAVLTMNSDPRGREMDPIMPKLDHREFARTLKRQFGFDFLKHTEQYLINYREGKVIKIYKAPNQKYQPYKNINYFVVSSITDLEKDDEEFSKPKNISFSEDR